MSFQILRKRTRRTVGTLAAVFFTGFIIFGFIDSYIKIKNSQIKKVDLVEVKIIADKPAADAILYEAVPTEQCIKQLTQIAVAASSANAQQSSSALFVAPAVSSSEASTTNSIASNTTVNKSSKSAKKIQPPEPPLIAAASPSCIAQSVVPEGIEKLGAEGFVALQLNLAANGKVERGEIEKSSGFAELDSAALQQVTHAWRFEPCKKAGAAVACKHRIRFRWEVK